MKSLNITLTEEEYKKLSSLKEKLGLSWHDFILLLGEEYKEQNNVGGDQ